MSIENLLSRLQKVKATGRDRWLCSCPSHNDKSPSMHIKLDDFGKILINCKAGCDTYSILQSIGLDWQDIMPEKATHHRQKPHKQVIYASEALALLQFEARLVLASAFKMRSKALTSDELGRLDESMQTINKVASQAGLYAY
jgi:DNA primase